MLKKYKTVLDKTDSPISNGRLELRSDAVQEILSHVPHWLISWGITIVFLVIMLLLAVSWIIKYPDVISARITLTTEHPPVKIVARSTGKLTKLFVEENQSVGAGAILAVIENPAEWHHVLDLKEQLQKFKTTPTDSEQFLTFKVGDELILGNLQTDYSKFIQALQEYQFVKQTDYHKNRIKSIQAQIASYQDLIGRSDQQKKLLLRESALVEKKYKNDNILFEKNLISEVELSNSETAYLQKKQALENAETKSINHNLRIKELKKTILDLRHEYRETNRRLLQSVHEAHRTLLSQLAIWEQSFILKTPVDGRVSFFKYWSENQFVNSGEEVMTILPNSDEAIIGKIYLPGSGAGKVKVGQTVKIKFDHYPFNEFGAVKGQVAAISALARDNLQAIDVVLPNGLRTNYQKTLEFKQGLQGTADIITEDLRILERIFNRLRYIFTSST